MSLEVNCLLVDDSEENLLALRAVLQDEGLTLHSARSGDEALELLLRHDFAVALIDVHMPGMSGIELAELMRGSERTKQIPIIFVTGGTWDEHRVFQGYETGAVDFLYKPIDPHVVRSKVRVFAELKRNMLALEEALAEAEETRARLRLLSDAGAALMSSLERSRGLSALAGVVLPAWADALVVDQMEPERGRLEAPFVSDVRDDRQRQLRQLVEDHDRQEGQRLLAKLFAARQPVSLREGAPEELSPFVRFGYGSMVTAPLEAHGRRFGAATLLRDRSRGDFTAPDQELAEELARRIALSFDNVRLFEEAEHAIRLRDEFLSVASHELRTPLTSMGLQIQRAVRMLDGPQSAGPLTKVLRRVHQTLERQSKTLQGLIEDMLDVTRASSGSLVLERRELSLSELVSEVAEEYSEQLAAAGCTLTLDIEPDCVGAFDARRIEQVVGNLLANAAKYAAGSPVHVSLRRRGDRARLCVRDEGPGISRDALSRIFERYQRADTVGHLPGLGLGLYVVRQIVLVHGGDIHVESNPGQGTSFLIDLPLEPREATAPVEAVFSP